MTDALLPRPLLYLAMDEVRRDAQGRDRIPDRADPRSSATAGTAARLIAEPDVGTALRLTGAAECWVELPWTEWKDRIAPAAADDTWDPANLTICSWVKVEATGSNAMVSLRSGRGQTPPVPPVDMGNTGLAVETGGPPQIWPPIDEGRWVHLAITVADRFAVTGFVDHVAVFEARLAQALSLASPRLLAGPDTGADSASTPSTGWVAGVRVYDAVLTSDELDRVAQLDKPPPSLPAPGARYPVRFIFRGSGDKPSLHFGSSAPSAKEATVEMVNDAPDLLVLQEPPAGATPSAEQHHIAITFRPGALDDTAAPDVHEASDDWSGNWAADGHGGGTLYLLCAHHREVPARARVSLCLVGLAAAAGQGARSTQVRFEHRQMHLAAARSDLVGDRHQVLSLLEETASDLAHDVEDLKSDRAGALANLSSHLANLQSALDGLKGDGADGTTLASLHGTLADLQSELGTVQADSEGLDAMLTKLRADVEATLPVAAPPISFSISSPTILLTDGTTRQTVVLSAFVRTGEVITVPREGGKIKLSFTASDNPDWGAAGKAKNVYGLTLNPATAGWEIEAPTQTPIRQTVSRALIPVAGDRQLTNQDAWHLEGIWGDASAPSLGPLRVHVKLENAVWSRPTDSSEQLPTEWVLTVPTGPARLDQDGLEVTGRFAVKHARGRLQSIADGLDAGEAQPDGDGLLYHLPCGDEQPAGFRRFGASSVLVDREMGPCTDASVSDLRLALDPWRKLTTTELTISFWIRVDGAADKEWLIFEVDGSPALRPDLSLWMAVTVRESSIALLFNGPAERKCEAAISSPTPWTHVAVTVQPSGFKLFLNGVLEGTWDGPATGFTADVGSIGVLSDGSGFRPNKGAISHIRLYTQALAAQQLAGDILHDVQQVPTVRLEGKTVADSIEVTRNLGGADGSLEVEDDLSVHGTLTINGMVYKPGGGPFAASSDATLKNEDGDYTDGLDLVRKLRPHWYFYNDQTPHDTEVRHVGLTAQDVREVAPYMVHKGRYASDEKDHLVLDPNAITYALVNAVRELTAMLEKSDQRIDELAVEVAGLFAEKGRGTKTQVERVKGIGPVTGRKLRAQGIASAEQLARLDGEFVGRLLGLSATRAGKLVANAKNRVFDKK